MSDKKIKNEVVKSDTTTKHGTWITTHTNDSSVRYRNCCRYMIHEKKAPTYKKETLPIGKTDPDKILVSAPMGHKK